MPRSKTLSKAQQENIRATIARSSSAIAARLRKHIDGDIDLKPTQVKAAQILLGKCLPDLSSSTIEDITPDYVNQDPQELVRAYEEEITKQIMSMSDEQIQAMRESPKVKQ